ncbi:MAG: hypothetical protein HAW64_03405 [Alphaproteobacteria bacterium]|nr:hypothetical protein [Alphaproteobacteria bacterium]
MSKNEEKKSRLKIIAEVLIIIMSLPLTAITAISAFVLFYFNPKLVNYEIEHRHLFAALIYSVAVIMFIYGEPTWGFGILGIAFFVWNMKKA